MFPPRSRTIVLGIKISLKLHFIQLDDIENINLMQIIKETRKKVGQFVFYIKRGPIKEIHNGRCSVVRPCLGPRSLRFPSEGLLVQRGATRWYIRSCYKTEMLMKILCKNDPRPE